MIKIILILVLVSWFASCSDDTTNPSTSGSGNSGGDSGGNNGGSSKVTWTSNDISSHIPTTESLANRIEPFDKYTNLQEILKTNYYDVITDVNTLGINSLAVTAIDEQITYLTTKWNSILGNEDYKEYDASLYGNAKMFAVGANFKNPDDNIGVLSSQYLGHTLKILNYLRATGGRHEIFIDPIKQRAAMAGSWSAFRGVAFGHYPSKAASPDIDDNLWDAQYKGRSQGNLYLFDGKTTYTSNQYVNFAYDTNVNNHSERLIEIWNEGEGDSIKGLGHRAAYLWNRNTTGIGLIRGHLVWVVGGGGDASDKPLIVTPDNNFIESWPSAVTSWRAIAGYDHPHNTWNVKIPASYSTYLASVKAGTITTIAVKMQLWTGNDLTSLTKTQEKDYTLTIGETTTAAYKNPYDDAKNPTTGGDYAYSGDGQNFKFRTPVEWWKQTDTAMRTTTKVYHHYRFIFNEIIDNNNKKFIYTTTVFGLNKTY